MLSGLAVLALIVILVACIEGDYAEAAWFGLAMLLVYLFLLLFL